MKATILKKIVNSLNLNRYYKDEFYKFLLGNNSGSSSEKIVCNLNENIGDEINNDDLNKIFSSLDFINRNSEDIMDRLIIKWKFEDDRESISRCGFYHENFGSTSDNIDIIYKTYMFITDERLASICIVYNQSDMSFREVIIDNPFYDSPV